MSDHKKTLSGRRIEEVWNQGNFGILDELVASDFVIHAPQANIHGPAGAAQFFAMLRTAFPDIHLTINDQIADGDRVVTRWTAVGTRQGEFQAIAPTGKRVRMSGTDIDRFADGKVVECWTNADELGLLQQLGVLPTATQTK